MKRSDLTVEKWRQIILEFNSKAHYENPFLEADIKAVFTGPSGRKIKREAYWDGSDIFKISFAPTELGVWKWSIAAEEKSGLDGENGEIECIEYRGELPIYKHGFLKVHPSGKYLMHDDGTPFFWLGDTHWEFAYNERWDWSNHPNMDSMFRGMADKRIEQGYNVYQTNLRSDSFMSENKNYWIDGNSASIPNVEFYQNELDRRMYYLADLGFVNALGFAWFMSILKGVEQQKNLARYIVARYGALPMVWTLAGEVAGYFGGEQRELCINGWREVAKYIEEIDGYGTIQTAHYTNERPFADYYQNESWFDFTLNQAGHGDFTVRREDYKEFLKKYSKKPFIEGECFYEFCSTLEVNGTRMCTADMVRRVAYMTIQLGGCGYTYGAQGIWDNVLEEGILNPIGAVFNRYDITWHEAIDGIGGQQMGYMKAFYEKVHFEEFMPYEDNSAGNENNPFAQRMPLISIGSNKDKVVIYYEDNSTMTTKVKGLSAGEYKSVWFNPRNGEYMTDSESLILINGDWEIPSKRDSADWVLVVEKQYR